MLDRCLNAVFATLLLAVFVPLSAWYSLRARLRSKTAVFHRTKSARIASLNRQIAAEFHFERAIEAYEDLIDSTFAEGQL